ncbi:hypothetical protein crov049 [Cafeteria roenbergensis virus]|uniref:Uncharacterized protein n=1 Tax=Cafeteria roenbergensis virus (strain BV-PW1) TaxID=693272 RepID=E3T4H0_CROVB|nr:hypothetical protein crov049 [Cafeteria roenbergensis virus BV-PW1]ADO67082.1 hypothetical protein crov049 [Cafeteria roenbergensis virus BV-PW1]
MEILNLKNIHYRVYDEIDTFVETGYCSYWKLDSFNQFIKPDVIKKNDGNFNFKFRKNKDKYILFTRKFNDNSYINVEYDNTYFYYNHYENDKLILYQAHQDYMVIHKLIINQMNNYKNILLSY